MIGFRACLKALAARAPVTAPALVALIALVPSVAAAKGWTRIGPPVGLVNALAVTRGPGSVLAATADAGVFRSDDGAISWAAANAGLGSIEVADVAADPADPATAYAATRKGLFKSSDGVRTWSMTGLGGSVVRVAIAPSAPRRLYAIRLDPLASSWRSADGGATWSEAGGGLAQGIFTSQALVVDPVAPDKVYAVLGWVLYSTVDGGRHWTDRSAGLPTSVIEAFAVDPRHPGILFAGGLGSFGNLAYGFFRSLDGGASWTALHFPFPATVPALLTVSPSGTLYAGFHHFSKGGPLFQSFFLYSSADRGATWTAEIVPEDVRSVVIDPGRTARVFAASATGVLRRLSPRPAWASAQAGLRAAAVPAVTADPHAPGTLYAGVRIGGETPADLGAWKSRDGGATWQAEPDGLNASGELLPIASFTVDPRLGNVVYAAAGLLFKSPDGGGHWSELPVAPALVESVAVSPRSSQHLFAAGWLPLGCSGLGCPDVQPRLRLLESLNGGAAWSDVTGRLVPADTQGQLGTVRIDPAHPWLVYVAGDRTFRSRDGGITFAGLPVDDGVFDLVLDPAFPRTLYASTGLTGRLLKSVDAGASWAPASAGLPADPAFQTGELAVDPTTRALYAATNRGLYLSRDQGATWQPLPGLPGPLVYAVAADPFRPGVVYAGTVAGLFAYSP
ncbi:MAG TPA: hypothetical protein VIH93_07855 [Thermoanaerobaculia bacterium]|jgi:photosystem II stability/assembly factor-like uncharacterized protein